MKKKLAMLLTCLMLGTALFTGCGGGTTEPETPDTDPPVEETADDGLAAPSEDEIMALFDLAYDAYSEISFGKLEYDNDATMEQDGYTYHKVTDARFPTYADYQTYLKTLFINNFVDRAILGEESIMFAEGKDGCLYMLGGGRGMNIFYAGHVFGEPEYREDEVELKVTAYYANNGKPYEGELLTEAPKNADDFKTEEYSFILAPEDGDAWKFIDFALFY